MASLRSVVLLVMVVGTWAAPTKDVQIVESTIREVRAAAPDDLQLAETSYDHNYGGADEDSVGYLKRSEDGGSDGYKHFDSYHKKDGDKYGYEKHTAFGKADNAEYDGGEKAVGNDKEGYKVSEELNEGDDGGSHEAYEDQGESEKYIEGGEAENSGEHYTEADDTPAHFTGEHFDFDGESAKYTEVAHDESGAEEADY